MSLYVHKGTGGPFGIHAALPGCIPASVADVVVAMGWAETCETCEGSGRKVIHGEIPDYDRCPDCSGRGWQWTEEVLNEGGRIIAASGRFLYSATTDRNVVRPKDLARDVLHALTGDEK